MQLNTQNSRLFEYDGSARYKLESFSKLTRCDQELESAVGCTCFNLFRFDLSVTNRSLGKDLPQDTDQHPTDIGLDPRIAQSIYNIFES
jgi:hypothetical protein